MKKNIKIITVVINGVEYRVMVLYKMVQKIAVDAYRSLYINSDEIIHTGMWWIARDAERLPNGKVKARKLNALAHRPGLHCAVVPWSNWIGQKMSDGSLARREGYVWLEVYVVLGKNYTPEARENGWKNGKFSSQRACLDYVPVDGYYWYSTNSKQPWDWAICGSCWVARELPENEVNTLCWEWGVEPQKLAV